MSIAGHIENAWKRAKDGDLRAGWFVRDGCLNYVRQLDDEMLSHLLESILIGTATFVMGSDNAYKSTAAEVVVSMCLDHVRQLDGDDIEVQVIESILEQILGGTDAALATWRKPGAGNPKYKRQWRDSVIVVSMRSKMAQGMGVREAANFLADQKFDTFTDDEGKPLTFEGIRRIWYRDKDKPDAHLTYGGLGDEWDDPPG